MHTPTVSISYTKGEHLSLFFLVPPVPFHTASAELAQQPEETSFASPKSRHNLESKCTGFPTQSHQGASALEGCRCLFLPHLLQWKQVPTSLATSVPVTPHISTCVLFLMLIPICPKSTLPPPMLTQHFFFISVTLRPFKFSYIAYLIHKNRFSH